MHTNRLAREKSPYLLQHAHNPVDWRSWGPEAFEKARLEDKPIFLSVGYSTCHWCHVMERESFEDARIAEILNAHFVPVKVDREERPDVDRIYMTFVQATTGSGGWPMSVWLTPELKPFYGGTYFPPDNRYGRPGFANILERIAKAWTNERASILESSAQVLEELKRHSEVTSASRMLDATVFDGGFFAFRRMFDAKLGGFGGAPKFPRPAVHNFLLREYARTGNQEALGMVLQTLRAMARGGMNDQLGGGFHRYSVDERWFVPHFEKMLYDQAQLAVSYLEAFQITGDGEFAAVARRILDYVLRDMASAEGAFYSAEDADSAMEAAQPHVKGEGAFYVWTQAEIEQLLGQPAAEWFCFRCGVEPGGNVRHDPHEEFTGRNILFEARTIEETAAHFGVEIEECRTALAAAKETLLGARGRRLRPHLDDKILTAWNGLMISAFCAGAQALDDERYLAAAKRATGFVLTKLWRADGSALLRRYRDGEAAIDGFLDDYAFLAQALLDLYETCFDLGYLDAALRITDKQRELFEDPASGAFFSTAAGDADLVLRMKDDYDGAEPSGNSVAALNLLRLAQITGRAELRESAEKTLGAFVSRLKEMPAGVPQMLVALGWSEAKSKEIILVGERDSARTAAMLRAVRQRFLPYKVVLLIDSEDARRRLVGWRAAVGSMASMKGTTTAYVCENYTCRQPVTDVSGFIRLLE